MNSFKHISNLSTYLVQVRISNLAHLATSVDMPTIIKSTRYTSIDCYQEV